MNLDPKSATASEAECLRYSAAPGFYDELEEAPGRVRAHWHPLLESLQQLGRDEWLARSQDGRRLIREHGVTYHAYGDPKGIDRPWRLDLVPLLVTASEWSRLEAALVQRSRLLNLILADIYTGSQLLLRDGFLPAELVYANPGFLRPCRGIPVRAGVYLHLHACDLGRGPDGRWWVLSDRTQAPGGIGYAWENRTVVSRVFPEEIRKCKVQSVSTFFQEQREMLFELAPPGCNPPSVVLLTPGLHNEIYFEHAFLARHLGFPLVEGADMTVRDRRVYLKTVEGLQPVDIIVRKLDDSFCDPLELRGDSFLGVPGLVDAARAGNVTIANALGAGLMESAALLAFLPGLSRHLLGEELLLPSVPTWWCGAASDMRYVLAHLDSLIIKPAFGPPASFRAASGAHNPCAAPAADRARLEEMIRNAPHQFVAQEPVQLSKAPSWSDQQLNPRSVRVRAFVANGGERVAVLPGGLTRVSKNPNDLSASLQTGGDSKDTWVLANRATPLPERMPASAESAPAEVATRGVPSRAADHLFWLGRYTERLEQLLRVLRCILGRLAGEPTGAGEREALAELAINLSLAGREDVPTPESLSQRILTLLYSPEERDGVSDLVQRIRSTASAVRDRFSGDTWRILGRLDTDAHAPPGRLPLANALELLHALVFDLAAFGGMEMENMTRGRGWRFLDFGRRLERGLSVVRLMQGAISAAAPSGPILEQVLEIADSVMTYRRLYFDRPCLPGVISVILADDSNPRALAFQVRTLTEHAAALEGGLTPEPLVGTGAVGLGRLASSLDPTNLSHLASLHLQGKVEPLRSFLESWAAELAGLSDQVTNRFFSHSLPRSS